MAGFEVVPFCLASLLIERPTTGLGLTCIGTLPFGMAYTH
jgi:hypothetical protein